MMAKLKARDQVDTDRKTAGSPSSAINPGGNRPAGRRAPDSLFQSRIHAFGGTSWRFRLRRSGSRLSRV